MSLLFNFLRSQLFVKPPYPTQDLTNQTIVVTGSNTGLGLEAARHFTRLNAEKVILAVRTVSKGKAAKKTIEESTGRYGVVEVWSLDLSSYASVEAFAAQLNGLKRLDALVENAGMETKTFNMTEEDEATITTNVVSTFLLALLALPKLRETATRYKIVPRLAIISSEVHFFTKFPERQNPSIFDALKKEETARMKDRYNVSKLLEVFYCRELATKMRDSKKPAVTLNFTNPGWCYTELAREGGHNGFLLSAFKALVARTSEMGSRTLFTAGIAGPETHGHYLSDCKVARPAPLVRSSEGAKTQWRVWDELNTKLEKIHPGILANI